MTKYNTTPFHYNEGMEFIISESKSEKNIQIEGYEAAILKALGKYSLLNKAALEIYANSCQPVQRQKPSYDKELNALYKSRYIIIYHYSELQNSTGRDNLYLYALSDKGIKYVLKNLNAEKQRLVNSNERYTTAAAIELAALNRFHIAIKTKYKSIIGEERYQMPEQILNNIDCEIPSIFKIWNSEGLYGDFTLATIPYMRSNSRKGNFLNNLMAVNAFFHTHTRFLRPVICVLVESFSQMEKAYNTIYDFSILENIQVLFTLDEYAKEAYSPLEWLFEISTNKDNNGYKLTTVNLLEKKHALKKQ